MGHRRQIRKRGSMRTEYPSDVAICIYGPKDNIIALVTAARIGGVMPEIDGSDLQMFDFGNNKHMIHAFYKNVEWNYGLPAVDTWNMFLKNAAAFDGVTTEFIRIGENENDIQIKREFEEEDADEYGENWYLGVNRSMRFDLPEQTSVNT